MKQITKTAEWVRKDEDEQIATGVLLVPDRIDSQGDWFTPETIRRVARDYMIRLQAGEAEQKIMHAVGAGEKVALVENRVLESAESIGDGEHGPGTWVVSVKVRDSRLWKLFQNETISGFSIGGDEVEGVDQAPGDVPAEVTRSAEYPDEATVTRIDGVTITEFSPVDNPAVGPAKVEVLKSLVKDAPLREGGQACIDALEDRGHSSGDAELLCEVMHSDRTDESAESDAEMAAGDGPTNSTKDMSMTESESETETTEKKEYSNGAWTTWPRLTGNSRGQVVDSETDPDMGFSDAISGDVSVSAEEDNPVYLLEVWDGVGDEAGAREESAGRGDTFHVANREDRLTSVSDPRELESNASADVGLIGRMRAALPFVNHTQSQSHSDESAESDSGAGDAADNLSPGDSPGDTGEHGDGDEDTQTASHADTTQSMTDEDTNSDERTTDGDTDAVSTEKLDAVLESVEALQDSVEENSERIDRVATGTAGTEQATGSSSTDTEGTGTDEDEPDDVAKFLHGLAGGK